MSFTANMAASLVSGTIPGYGSITRSRIAANTGARSPLFSFFVSAFSLITTLSLLKYLFYLPKAVLSCIISLVVYSILAEFPEDVHFFVRMRAWTDLALMGLAFALTLLSSVQVRGSARFADFSDLVYRLESSQALRSPSSLLSSSLLGPWASRSWVAFLAPKIGRRWMIRILPWRKN